MPSGAYCNTARNVVVTPFTLSKSSSVKMAIFIAVLGLVERVSVESRRLGAVDGTW
jgi:hypothetical protein